MTALILALLIGAIWRVTRLFVLDTIPIIKVPRDAIVTFFDPDDDDVTEGRVSARKRTLPERSLGYLAQCGWCMSMWVAAVMVPVTAHWVSVPAPWLVWLTASGITGALINWEAIHDKRYELIRAQTAATQAAALAALPDHALTRG